MTTRPTFVALALAYERAIIMLVQHAAVTPGWLTPPEDGDHLRSALEHAAKVARARGDDERATKIEAILWDPITYRSEFLCSDCGVSGSEISTDTGDSECPDCGEPISLKHSERIA